jgi:hypothetical protein
VTRGQLRRDQLVRRQALGRPLGVPPAVIDSSAQIGRAGVNKKLYYGFDFAFGQLEHCITKVMSGQSGGALFPGEYFALPWISICLGSPSVAIYLGFRGRP